VSCAHWASWRLGLTLATARERVRVARALRELPVLSGALARHEQRVLALTRPAEGKPVTVRLLVDPVSGWARTSKDELLPPSTVSVMLAHAA
jgi:hypothetical protein